jgi:hypothetical protein
VSTLTRDPHLYPMRGFPDSMAWSESGLRCRAPIIPSPTLSLRARMSRASLQFNKMKQQESWDIQQTSRELGCEEGPAPYMHLHH